MSPYINFLERIYQELKTKRIVLTKDEYAKALGFSRAQLYRLYDDPTTVTNEILEKAKSLLNETNNVSRETSDKERPDYRDELIALLRYKVETLEKKIQDLESVLLGQQSSQ